MGGFLLSVKVTLVNYSARTVAIAIADATEPHSILLRTDSSPAFNVDVFQDERPSKGLP